MKLVGLGPQCVLEINRDLVRVQGSRWNVYSKVLLFILVSECCQNIELLNKNSSLCCQDKAYPVFSKSLGTGSFVGEGTDWSRKALHFSYLSYPSVHLFVSLCLICLFFLYVCLKYSSVCCTALSLMP